MRNHEEVDPFDVLDEIHKVRRRLSERFDDGPKKIAEHGRKLREKARREGKPFIKREQ